MLSFRNLKKIKITCCGNLGARLISTLSANCEISWFYCDVVYNEDIIYFKRKYDGCLPMQVCYVSLIYNITLVIGIRLLNDMALSTKIPTF